MNDNPLTFLTPTPESPEEDAAENACADGACADGACALPPQHRSGGAPRLPN